MSHIKYNHVPLPTLECGRVWATTPDEVKEIS